MTIMIASKNYSISKTEQEYFGLISLTTSLYKRKDISLENQNTKEMVAHELTKLFGLIAIKK